MSAPSPTKFASTIACFKTEINAVHPIMMAVSSPTTEQHTVTRRRNPRVTSSAVDSNEAFLPADQAKRCRAVSADAEKHLDDNPGKFMETGPRGRIAPIRAAAKFALTVFLGIIIGLLLSPRLLVLQDPFEGYPRYTDPHDIHHGFADLLIRTANRSQPLLQYMDNAMPAGEFADLQKCLRDHPMRHHNVNNDATFGATKGFIVSFNERGITNVAQHKHFGCLLPYFMRHRLPNCNAWILNMVWAEVPKYDKEFAITRHTDDALEMAYPGQAKILPFQTSVLYTFLPEDMEGGEIEAYPYEMEQHEMDMSPPHGRVTPKLNRMAYFRGDAWHQVRSYKTKSKDVLRASLVLENYQIPISLEKYVVPFTWTDGKPEMM